MDEMVTKAKDFVNRNKGKLIAGAVAVAAGVAATVYFRSQSALPAGDDDGFVQDDIVVEVEPQEEE
ncbi:MAG: hypothetical protein HUJ62_05600 [Streptococcus gallolyticus]|nr:hypothetical protein [Streptococcus gallolyticus]